MYWVGWNQTFSLEKSRWRTLLDLRTRARGLLWMFWKAHTPSSPCWADGRKDDWKNEWTLPVYSLSLRRLVGWVRVININNSPVATICPSDSPILKFFKSYFKCCSKSYVHSFLHSFEDSSLLFTVFITFKHMGVHMKSVLFPELVNRLRTGPTHNHIHSAIDLVQALQGQ